HPSMRIFERRTTSGYGIRRLASERTNAVPNRSCLRICNGVAPTTSSCLGRIRPAILRHRNMTLNDIRTLFEYDRWANARALDAVMKLTDEQFTRNLGGSFASIRDTIVHL